MSAAAASESPASIAGLFVYPVKSCRGLAIDVARLADRGLEHDREWMIVAATPDRSVPLRFVTQRELPALALVRTQLTARALVLSAPGLDDLAIPFDRDGERCRAVVWRDTVVAIDQGRAAAEWLSAHAGAHLRLVRFDPDQQRLCNPAFAGDSGAHTAFADAYPVLVTGSASLADLNARLAARGQAPLPMNRFRPNVVIAGLDAYDEDHLAMIRIGEVVLRLVKPCTRCRITTTDQDTADIGDEPLATLAGYRMDTQLDGVTFGMNAIVERGAGSVIARGAAVAAEWNF